MDLPTIVARIHEQRPDIDLPEMDFFPGVPGAVAPAWRITAGRETFYVPHFAAIAIVEAAMWRVWHKGRDLGARVIVQCDFPKPDGDDPLSLILAICHAVGIELEDK